MTAAAKNTATVKPSAKAEKVKGVAPKAIAKVEPRKPSASRIPKAKVNLLREEAAVYALPSPMVRGLLPGTNADDPMAVFRATQLGFSLGAVIELVESVEAFKRYNVLSKIVGFSERTLARRLKNQDQALTPEQSARALHYAQVLEKAEAVLGSRALAEEWMTQPALGLDGEVPIDLLANPVGYELVTDFLHRLEFGVY
ncbi:type II RES/Xre toxin-antitoxin system antitoxin [Pseudomonas chlororaphis]|uniref:type II RES/Xre toxin-antitoxin system antitoxin n=1 Tax=Pseudomonas chlororaphis TaxID=587753 RepID=UPI000D0FFA00|nr:antitoxin Xre/MbcA/ParS toxin-binding domain-containing protein [Pseudomonas chlororaphis]AVO62271.1 toxin-antitoxin system antitoxin subunit [Pseudomonas chlororaphis subsp. piscium]